MCWPPWLKPMWWLQQFRVLEVVAMPGCYGYHFYSNISLGAIQTRSWRIPPSAERWRACLRHRLKESNEVLDAGWGSHKPNIYIRITSKSSPCVHAFCWLPSVIAARLSPHLSAAHFSSLWPGHTCCTQLVVAKARVWDDGGASWRCAW